MALCFVYISTTWFLCFYCRDNFTSVCLQFAGRDAENLKWILDQLQALHTDPTGRTTTWPPGQHSRQLSPLKALTEQLKKGGTGRQVRASDAQRVPPAADPTGSLGPELAGRVDLALKELQSLNRKIDSNLHLLQPYVAFLRTALQVRVSLGLYNNDAIMG